MELEPQPQEFVWYSDARGEYVIFKDGDWEFASYADNTLMYLFPDKPGMDHIFLAEDVEGTNLNGKVVWRRQVDDIFGEGAFGRLCTQMFERGFDHAPDEEPQEGDYRAYELAFKEPYRQAVTSLVGKIVEREMIKFEEEAEYYLGHEWS